MKLIGKVTDEDLGLELFEFDNPKERFASRGIVLNDEGKIAIFNQVNKNEYKLPGGGKEEDELIEETFKREVLEETGCEVEIIDYLGYIIEEKTKNNFRQRSDVFLAKVIKDYKKLNLTKQEIDEGGKLVWLEPKEALNKIINSKDKVLGSKYDDLYMTLFKTYRDIKILKYYLNEYKK